MMLGQMLTKSMPKEIGTSNSGSYPRPMARYRKKSAAKIMMKLPGVIPKKAT